MSLYMTQGMPLCPEVSASGPARHRRRKLAASLQWVVLLGALGPALVMAAPEGAQVTAGIGAVEQAGTHTLVTQQSPKLVVDWNSFSVAPGENVVFNQPGATAVALNRVLGQDVSRIFGTLTANGQVFIVNPNGVLFGPGAQVSAGGLVASALGLSNQEFLAGNYRFEGSEAAASVVNEGTLTAASGGYLALLAPEVRNEGVMVATLGTALLAAGDKVSLQLEQGSLLSYAVDRGAVNALAENRQLIQAAGGQVILSARAADALAGSVVNNSGIIEAQTITNRNGVIRLEGGSGGQVNVSGTLAATGRQSGEVGGTIDVIAGNIALEGGASLDASGAAGGGTILVGGKFSESADAQPAQATRIDRDARIAADALEQGDGGRVIVWSDGDTQAQGTVSARGGELGGNGGFVELSGKQSLGFSASVDTRASHGQTGELLLDPLHAIISADADAIAGDTQTINATALVSNLNANNITVQADTSLTVNANVDASGNTNGYNLTLDAPLIDLNALITLKLGQSLTGTAATVNVNGTTASINNGMAVVASAGTVQVAAGSYAEPVNIATNGVTMRLGGDVTVNSLANSGTSPQVDLQSHHLTVGDASSTSYTGVITGAGGLTKAGNGTLTLSGANTFTGLTNITGGSIAYGANNVLAGGVTVAGGALEIGTFSDTIGAVTLTSGAINGTSGALTATSYAVQDGTISANLAGTGALTKTTAGTVTLSGTSTRTGATTVNAGTLSVGAVGNGGVPGNLGAASNAAANLVMGGGTLQYTGPTATTNRQITFTTGTTSTIDVLSGALTLTGPTANTTGSVTKTGAGTLVLSAANQHRGLTSVLAGTLAYGNNNAISTGSVTVNAGTLDIGTFTDSVGTFTLLGGGSLLGITGMLTASSYAVQSGTIDAILGGTGTLTKSTGGTVSLSRASPRSGATAISGGTLAYGVDDALAAGAVTLTGGGILDLGSWSDTVGLVTLTSGSILGSTGALTGTGYAVQSGTISAVLAGAGNLTKSGTGTVTLSGVNTYTGITTISAGTLSVGSIGDGGVAGNLGAASGAPANLVLGAGTLLYTGGDASTDRNFTLTPATTSTINVATGNLSLTGTSTANTGALTKSGAGTLTLAGANLHTGLTTISGGTLRLGVATALPVTNTIALGNVAGATLDLNGLDTTLAGITGGGTTGGAVLSGVAGPVTLTLNPVGAIAFGGRLQNGTGVLALAKQGTQTLTLSGANTFTGGLFIPAGTVSGATNAAAFGAGTITLGDTSGVANATLNGGLTGTFANPITVAAGSSGLLRITNSANSIFSGPVSLANNLTLAPALTSALTLSGGITGAGNLTIAGTGTTAAVTLSANPVNMTGTITNQGSNTGTTTISGGIGANVTAVTQSSTTSPMTISGLLTVNPAGTTLTNTLGTRILTVSGGVAGTGDLTLNNNSTLANGITLSGASVNSVGAVTNSGSGTGSTLISAVIGTNAAGLTQASATSGLTLSGINLFTGTTTVNAGTLTYGASNVLANASTMVIDGGTLALVTFSDTVGGVQLKNGAITSTTGILISTTNIEAEAGTLSAILAGTAGLTKTTAGTLTLTGVNTYTGLTAINDGTLRLGGANRIGNSSAVDVATGATFDLNGFADTIGSLAGAGTVTSGAAGSVVLGIGTNNTSTEFSGVLENGSGTLGLTKSGTGTQTLSGINTYTGVTTLNAGGLSIASLGDGGVAGNLGAASNAASNLVLGGGTLLYTGTAASTDRNFTLTTGTTSTLNISAALTLTGASTATTGALTKQGAGTLTLGSANLHTGLTSVFAGTLAYGSNNALATGAVTINGGTLDVGAFNDSVGTVTLINGALAGSTGVLTGTGYAVQNGTIGAILGGTGALTKTTAGTVDLNQANLYTGLTTISAGTLRLGVATALPVTNTVTLGNVSGATLDLNGLDTTLLAVTGGGTTGGAVLTGTAGPATLTLDSAVNAAFGGRLQDGAGTLALVKKGSNTLTLSGASNFSGGLFITSGTVSGTTNGAAFGTGRITLGDTSGVANATLNGGLTGTFANPITVAAGSSGLLRITNSASSIFSGAVTLERDLTLAPTLTSALTLSGGITGAGNLTIAGTGTTAAVTVSVNPVNMTGTVTNQGSNTGTTTISGGIGTNVTAVTQSSTTSPMTISGLLTVNPAGTTLTNTLGTRILTVSGGVAGTGDLSLNNNSTLASGITLSGGSVNPVGTLTNSGSGTGSTLISAVIGTNAAGLTQASATSGLTLSGVNLFTGTTTVNAGTLTYGASNVLANASTVVIDGGTLALATFSDTVGGVQLKNGAITSTTGILTSTTNIEAEAGTLSAILAGTAGLTKTTAGTLTLTGVNTYTGPTAITEGTLRLGGANRIGNSSAVEVSAGATFDLNGFADTIGSLAGGGTVTSGAAGSVVLGVGTNNQSTTFSGILQNGSGTVGLNKSGTGTLTLEGLNTYTGVTTLGSGGALRIGALNDGGVAGNLGAASTAATNLVFSGGTLFYIGAAASSNRNFTLTTGTTTTFNISDALALNGSSTATTGALTKQGAGTLTLGGTNLYTGLTSILAGTLAHGSNNALAAGAVTINGGTLDVGTFNDSVGTVTLINGALAGTSGVLTGTGYAVQNGTIGAILGGTAALTKTTAGTVTLTNSSTYSGTTTISAGTLVYGSDNALGAGAVTISGGSTLDIGAFNDSVGTVTLTSGTLTGTTGVLSGAFALQSGTVSAILGGTGALTKSTAGTVVLNRLNVRTGVTTLTAGILSIDTLSDGGVPGNLGAASTAAGNLVFGGGTLQYNGTTASSNRNFTLSTGTTTTLELAAGDLTLSGASTATTGGLIKLGSGTLTLGGANLYTGTTTINAGTLAYGGNNALASGAVIINGATFDVGTFSDTVGAVTLTGNGTIAGTTGVLSGSSYAFQSGTVDAILGGAGALTKTTAGVVTLNGVNTRTGITTINAGTLSVATIGDGGVAGGLGAATNAAANLILGGGTLQYTGATASTNRNFTLTAGTTSAIELTGGDLTIAGASTATTGALTKLGTGTLTLAGANLYSGATRVSAGRLIAAHATALGSVAGGTTIDAGASLEIANVAVGSEAITLRGTGSGTGALLGSGTASLAGTLTVSADTTIGGSGNLSLGDVVLADDALLTLGTGGVLNISTGAINGTAAGSSSDLNVATLGSLVLGNVGTDIGVVDIVAGATTLNDVTAGRILVNTGAAALTLAPGAVLNATNTGNVNALRIVTTTFTNNSGSGAATLQTGSGSRWLVYSGSPTTDTRGGVVADFKQYAAAYGDAVAGSGNGLLYTFAPVITPTLIGTSTKEYNGTTAAALTAGNYSFTGAVDGDTVVLNNPAAGIYADKNVGVAKAVTVSGITGSYSNGATTVYGYQIANGGVISGNIGEITAKALTITANGIDKVYDGNTAATVSYGDNRIGGDVLSITGSAAFIDKNAAAGKSIDVTGIALGGTDAGNYTFNTTATTAAAITKAALTISATGVDKVYDGTTAATVSYADNRISGDVLSIAGTAAFTDKHAAAVKTINVTGIALGGADANNYTFNGTATTTAEITKAALTIGATGIDKVYNGNTSASVTYSDNRIGGDVLSITGTAAFIDKNAAAGKTINVTGIALGGVDAGNYSFNTTATTTAEITKAALTIAATGSDKVYDGTTSATVSYADNRISGDALSITGTAAFTDKNAAPGKTINVSGIALGGVDAGNYTFNTTATTSAEISKAALTISATGIDRVYDTTTSASVTLADNRVAGDVLSYSGNAAFTDKNAAAGKTVNVTGITLGGTDAGNYTFNTTATTTAEITKAPLTIGATGIDKVYDGSTNASVTYSDNRIGSDVLNISGTAAFTDKNAAAGKIINVTGIALSGTDAGNYTFNTTATTTAEITKAPLTIGATGSDKVYDGNTNASVTYTDNRISGDALSITGTAAFTDKNAAPGKTINVSGIALGGVDAGNYTFNTTATAAAAITPAPLTLTGVVALNKIYDGTRNATITGYTLGGLVGGETLTASFAGAQFSTKDAGTGKSVSFSGVALANGSGLTSNYAISGSINGTLTTTAAITPATLRLGSITAMDKVYDGTRTATLEPLPLNGLVAGETLDVRFASALFDSKDAGVGKTVTINGIALADGSGRASNYVLEGGGVRTTSATIAPRALTIAANAASKSFDNLPWEGGDGVTISGFVNAEGLGELQGTLGFQGDAQGAVTEGTWVLTPSGLSSGNYAITYVDGVLTISPAAVTVRPELPQPEAPVSLLLPPVVLPQALVGILQNRPEGADLLTAFYSALVVSLQPGSSAPPPRPGAQASLISAAFAPPAGVAPGSQQPAASLIGRLLRRVLQVIR